MRTLQLPSRRPSMPDSWARAKKRSRLITPKRLRRSVLRWKKRPGPSVRRKRRNAAGLRRRRNATPPFTTSKLQQDSSRKLRFSVKRTMMIAQRLYEGVELGEEGLVGLITYMRTDSTRVAPDAIAEVREYIGKEYGQPYIPESPNTYKEKKEAQAAHE